MLVLSRKKGETIIVGDNIEVCIIDIQGDNVRVGIKAPREVSVFRKEIFEEIKRENLKAADNIQSLTGALEKLKSFQIKDKD